MPRRRPRQDQNITITTESREKLQAISLLIASLRAYQTRKINSNPDPWGPPQNSLGSFVYDYSVAESVVYHPAIEISEETTYTGEWNQAKQRHGRGRQDNADGSHYEGYWERGLYNGKGRLTLKDGSVYEGQYRDGKKHGYGVQYNFDNVVYRGNWEFDKQCGYGVETWPDQTRYEGDYYLGTK